MSWAFAIINGRLAEFFFDTKTKKNGKSVTRGHCYVKKGEIIYEFYGSDHCPILMEINI